MQIMAADLLTTLPQLVLEGIIVARFLKNRRLWLFTALLTIGTLLLQWLFGYQLAVPQVVRSLTTLFWLLALTMSFCKIPRIQAVAYLALYLILMMLLELPVDLMLLQRYPNMTAITDLPLTVLVLSRMVYLPFYSMSLLIPYALFRRFLAKVREQEFTKFLPILVTQCFLMLFPTWIALGTMQSTRQVLLVCALFLLANILLDVFLLGTFRRAQQVYEAQRQVQEAENLLKAQSEYYHQLQGSAAALKGLQSEMVETLRHMSRELSQQHYDNVLRELSDFRSAVEQTGRCRYTGNAVVDAVLEEKSRQCRQKGITLKIQGIIPTDVAVEPIHLCSIAGNLLDNAIHACDALGPEAEKTIEFTARMQGPRLVFLCRNTAAPGQHITRKQPELTRAHGWGLSILERIAGEYQGQLMPQSGDGWVQVLLWLIPGSSQKAG